MSFFRSITARNPKTHYETLLVYKNPSGSILIRVPRGPREYKRLFTYVEDGKHIVAIDNAGIRTRWECPDELLEDISNKVESMLSLVDDPTLEFIYDNPVVRVRGIQWDRAQEYISHLDHYINKIERRLRRSGRMYYNPEVESLQEDWQMSAMEIVKLLKSARIKIAFTRAYKHFADDKEWIAAVTLRFNKKRINNIERFKKNIFRFPIDKRFYTRFHAGYYEVRFREEGNSFVVEYLTDPFYIPAFIFYGKVYPVISTREQLPLKYTEDAYSIYRVADFLDSERRHLEKWVEADIAIEIPVVLGKVVTMSALRKFYDLLHDEGVDIILINHNGKKKRKLDFSSMKNGYEDLFHIAELLGTTLKNR